MVRVILAFIPKEDATRLKDASATLAQQVPLVTILGRNSVPHATVLIFDTPNPKLAWEQLFVLHGVSQSLALTQPYQNDWAPGTTFGFGVMGEGIDMVQKEALRLLNLPPEAIHNVVGESYVWHITIGTTNEPVVKHIYLPILEGTSIECTLHLGECGPRNAFTKILF